MVKYLRFSIKKKIYILYFHFLLKHSVEMFILRVITFFLEYYFIKGYFKKLNDGNNSVFVSQEKHFTLKRITKLSTDNIAHLKITQKRRDNVFSSLRQIESSFDLIAT